MIRIEQLAYIVAQCRQVSRWRPFAEEVLGMATAPAPDGALYVKMDERAFRFLIEPGADDRYLASGWQLADEAAFEAAARSLQAAGVAHERATPALCAARKVQGMLLLRDPSGNRHELVWGFQSDFSRFVSPQGVPGFVTGALGMGHTVLPAPDFDATWRFAQQVLGFGLADLYRHRYTQDPQEPLKRIYFTHCANGRHHSLALYEGEVPSGCVHAMVEVASMDEVGRAYDRMLRHGVKLMATLGRHVNDQMISFYMLTPSGFALEFGCGGAVIDWTRHSVFEATAVSQWGHDFSVGFG